MPKRAGIKKSYAEKKLEKIKSMEIFSGQFDELTFLIKKHLYKISKIDAVVLFGSFARGDYSPRHSDMDIMVFLDETEKNHKLEEQVLREVNSINLGKLIAVHTLFQYRKIGEDDSKLMLAVSNEGKTIFAKKSIIINNDILGLKSFYLIIFDTAGVDQVRKNKLNRFLHGYKVNGKKFIGIIDNENVFSAGRGAIIAPKELLNKIIFFADSIKVKARQAGEFYR